MEYDVKVVGGQLVLLSKALLPAIKNDVLNSLLLIQLYADDKADKFGRFSAWGQCQAEAQVNTKWTHTYTQTSAHETSAQAETTLTALATDYLANILGGETSLPADAVAIALNAVMHSSSAQTAFVKAVLKANPVQSSHAVDGTSNIIVQVCVVEPQASLFSVEINLLVGGDLEGNIFVHPIKGEGVIGAVEVTLARLEMNSADYESVRENVLDMIKKLNANRTDALKVIDLSVPPSVIAELAALPG